MIDVYSLCPGGTGKKIKFCCRNRVEDFRKIYKFLDANQHTACLNFIDQLLRSDSKCACLLAIRCVILKALPTREDDLIETAKRFYELHPENPIAIAESAQAILMEGKKAIEKKFGKYLPAPRSYMVTEERNDLQEVVRNTMLRYEKAFATEHPFQYEQVVYKLEMFVEALIQAGFYEAADAWLGLVVETDMYPAFRETMTNVMQQFKTNKAIQLCFRVGLKVHNARPDAVWTNDFNTIVSQFVTRLYWTQAIEEFKKLAEKYPDVKEASEYWFDLALLHEWICDLETASTLWKKYVSCAGVSFYDSLEKRIRMSFFKECPLEDEMDICALSFPITDCEALLQRLTNEPTFHLIPKSEEEPTDRESMPVQFDILSLPMPENAEEQGLENIPVVVGNALLWDKTEAYPARLDVINVLQGGADFVTKAILDVISPWLAGEVQKQVLRSVSVTVDSILRKIALPSSVADEKVREIKNLHCREILLNRWIHFPLGILKNMSMKKAAKHPEMRFSVEAVLYVLRYILEQDKLDTNVLRELRLVLELPPLPKIDCSGLGTLSPIFFDQLEPGDWTPETLERVFFISRVFNSNNIPQEILEKAADDPKHSPELRIEILKTYWSANPLSKRSVDIIEKGRALCEENHLPDVFFDIMEVAYSIGEGKFQTVFEKIKHIRQEHSGDEEAMQYVTKLSQYMYGVIQNMNLSDLSLLQQKTAKKIPMTNSVNPFGTDNLIEGIHRSIRSGKLADASANLNLGMKKS